MSTVRIPHPVIPKCFIAIDPQVPYLDFNGSLFRFRNCEWVDVSASKAHQTYVPKLRRCVSIAAIRHFLVSHGGSQPIGSLFEDLRRSCVLSDQDRKDIMEYPPNDRPVLAKRLGITVGYLNVLRRGLLKDKEAPQPAEEMTTTLHLPVGSTFRVGAPKGFGLLSAEDAGILLQVLEKLGHPNKGDSELDRIWINLRVLASLESR